MNKEFIDSFNATIDRIASQHEPSSNSAGSASISVDSRHSGTPTKSTPTKSITTPQTPQSTIGKLFNAYAQRQRSVAADPFYNADAGKPSALQAAQENTTTDPFFDSSLKVDLAAGKAQLAKDKEVYTTEETASLRTNGRRASLLAELSQLDKYSGTTPDYEDKRKRVVTALNEVDSKLGNDKQDYAPAGQRRLKNIGGAILNQTAGGITDFLGAARGFGNQYREDAKASEKAIAENKYLGMLTDDFSPTQPKTTPEAKPDMFNDWADYSEIQKTDDYAKQSRIKEQALYDKADEYNAHAAESTAKAKDGLGAVGQFGVDAAITVGQMGLDAVGNAVGLGMIPMFVRAAGSAAGEARHAGADNYQAFGYGLTSGAIEVATEKMYDGVAGLFGKGLADDAVEATIKEVAKTPKGATLLRLIASAVGEGGEELASDMLQPFAQLIYDKNAVQKAVTDPDFFKQALYDFLLGTATGLLGGVGGIANRQDAAKNAAIFGDTTVNVETVQAQAGTRPTETQLQESLNAVVVAIQSGRINNTTANAIQSDPIMKAVFEQLTGITLNGTKIENRTTIQNVARQVAQSQAQTDAQVQQAANQAQAQNVQAEAEAVQTAEMQQIRNSGYDSYIRGVLMSGVDASEARQIATNPELRATWERMSGKTLPDNPKSAVKMIMQTQRSNVALDTASAQPQSTSNIAQNNQQTAQTTQPTVAQRVDNIINEAVNPEPTQSTQTTPIQTQQAPPITQQQLNLMEDTYNNHVDDLAEWVDMHDLSDEGYDITQTPEYQSKAAALEQERQALEAARAQFQAQQTPVAGSTASAPAPAQQQTQQGQATPIIPQPVQSGEGNMRERGGSRNDRTNQNVRPEIREAFEAAPEMYRQLSNAETYEAARTIFNSGFPEAYQYTIEKLTDAKNGKKLPIEVVPLSVMVANELAAQGRTEEAVSLRAAVAVETTYAGQLGQAGRIMRVSDPVTRAAAIEQLIKKYNAQLTESQKKHNAKVNEKQSAKSGVELNDSQTVGDISVPQNLIDAYANASTDAEMNAAINAIEQSIANQIPPTALETWNAIRFTGMLFNFKTIERNVIGNINTFATYAAKRRVQATIEAAYKIFNSEYQKNASFAINPKTYVTAWNDITNVFDALTDDGVRILGEGRITNKSIQEKRSLPHGIKELNEITRWLLNNKYFGDEMFLRINYAEAFAGWLQARGIQDISSADPKLIEQGRVWAIKEAKEATFHDDNVVSNYIAKLGRGENTPKAIKVLVESQMPFKKTPANIFVRAEEFSPLGVANTIVTAVQSAKGTKNSADVINSVSKTLTGSALFGAGVLLAAAGKLRFTGNDDDKQANNFDKTTGASNNSLILNGKYLSISQFAPQSSTLLMGAAFYECLLNGGFNSTDDVLTLASAVTNPLLESSMLQSGTEVLTTALSSGEMGDALVYLAILTATNYVGQAIPQILSQTANFVHENRQTIYTNPDSALGSKTQYALYRTLSRIPGLGEAMEFQQDYIDAWGRTQSQGSTWERFVNSYINPTYSTRDTTDDVDAELKRLHAALQGVDDAKEVLPQSQARSLTYDPKNKDSRLSPEEYQQFSIDFGQKSHELVSDFIHSPEYQLMTDDQRDDVISSLYTLAKDRAMKTIKTAHDVEYTGNLDSVASLKNIPSYYASKEILSGASDESPNYSSIDSVIASFNTVLGKDVQAKLQGESSLKVNDLLYARSQGVKSKEFYEMESFIKDMQDKTGTSDIAAALAINNEYSSDAEKFKMLSIACQPTNADTGKKSGIVLRYESALENGISFDTWSKLEAQAKTLAGQAGKSTPTKQQIYTAAKSVGIEGWKAYKIFKKYYGLDDSDMYDSEWSELHPAKAKTTVDYFGAAFGDRLDNAASTTQSSRRSPLLTYIDAAQRTGN